MNSNRAYSVWWTDGQQSVASICRKIRGLGQSGQAIKLFQAPSGSSTHVFYERSTSLVLHCRLIINSFSSEIEWLIDRMFMYALFNMTPCYQCERRLLFSIHRAKVQRAAQLIYHLIISDYLKKILHSTRSQTGTDGVSFSPWNTDIDLPLN